MKTTGDLFDDMPPPPPSVTLHAHMRDAAARSTDPETAHAAAASVDSTKLEGTVIDCLRLNGPMTTHELADRTGLDLVSISPRMRPLVRKRLIRNSGKKRKGRSFRQSILWEIRR